MDNRRMRTNDSVLAALKEACGIDCYLAPFWELAAKVAELEAAARSRLLPIVNEAFSIPRYRIHQPTRVASAKILVALLPDSLDVIKRWMKNETLKAIREVHFSLFCFFDEVQDFPHLKPARSEVLEIVANYLMGTRSNAAQAAWMAGDLLGDHWNLRESLPLLIQIAEGARGIAGREAAVHGLSKALARCSDADYARITATLDRMSKSDPSPKVRRTAEMSLSAANEALSAL